MKVNHIPRTDYHIHSQFSPCARGMTIWGVCQRAEELGIKRIAITDHGVVSTPNWIESYFEDLEKARRHFDIDILSGIEVNILPDGNPAVKRSLLRDFEIVIGAIHGLPSLSRFGSTNLKVIYDEYERSLHNALGSRWMDILAHPTDVGWMKIDPPNEFIEEVVKKISKAGVAVEINYHHRDPSPSFIRICLDHGVLLTPTSDAHRIGELGRYNWHLSVLERTGFNGRINWFKP